MYRRLIEDFSCDRAGFAQSGQIQAQPPPQAHHALRTAEGPRQPAREPRPRPEEQDHAGAAGAIGQDPSVLPSPGSALMNVRAVVLAAVLTGLILGMAGRRAEHRATPDRSTSVAEAGRHGDRA
ncbi:hypothetical protein [Streptomyces tsukubensis]|uniref:Uncharacterized protein n=1 Tax=Streptomyces tsukubensis TaxID=83656 RepID=A0A1V4A001_9ACTN|nr:hypothetical protein [Streptomyces tsukubensis]OON71781.1 hypothetical protein B1H18_32405 [Streptomyces tsukubensis]QFR97032.1 hypothetical protein GBW32_33215 [Streptomyces tsukubensis]